MVLISSDVLLSAFLVLISRDLFKVRLSTLFVSSAYQSLNKNQEGRLALKEKMPYQSPPTVFWVLNMAAIFRQGLIVIELALAIEFWYQTSSLGSNFHGEEITKITGADLGMFGGQGVNWKNQSIYSDKSSDCLGCHLAIFKWFVKSVYLSTQNLFYFFLFHCFLFSSLSLS